MQRATLTPPPARKRAARAAALLLSTILFAGCLSPSGQPSQGPIEPAPAPVAEAPKPEPEKPAPTPAPEPTAPVSEPPAPAIEAPKPKAEPPKPLPPMPEGEPTRFVSNVSRACKMVALTYDAGSGADGAPAVLDMLKKYDLKVTFFLTGKWVEKYPDLAKRIADEGHEIGNHSYSHPDFTQIADEEILEELKKTEEIIKQVTGKDPRPLFREPYGAFNEHERRVVRQAGYSYSIYWDVDTLDWQFPPIETLVSRIMRAQGGSIVLMHMNVPDTAVASDQAIPQLQAQGYQIVPISQLLQCEAN